MSTVSWNEGKPLISVGTFPASNALLQSDSRSQKSSHSLAAEKLHKEFVYPRLLHLANKAGCAGARQGGDSTRDRQGQHRGTGRARKPP